MKRSILIAVVLTFVVAVAPATVASASVSPLQLTPLGSDFTAATVTASARFDYSCSSRAHVVMTIAFERRLHDTDAWKPVPARLVTSASGGQTGAFSVRSVTAHMTEFTELAFYQGYQLSRHAVVSYKCGSQPAHRLTRRLRFTDFDKQVYGKGETTGVIPR